jgi:hypothetical protein
MKKLLILTAFALFSTVANAACPDSYTPYGPFCAATFAERFGEWVETPEGTVPANPGVAVVELSPVDIWTSAPVPYTTPGLPFVSAYGDTSNPPFVPDENASQKIAKMEAANERQSGTLTREPSTCRPTRHWRRGCKANNAARLRWLQPMPHSSGSDEQMFGAE